MNKIQQKSAIQVTIIFACLFVIAKLFFARFTISIPSTESQCLEAKMFLVDKKDKNIKRGDLVAFTFNKEDEHFDKGMSFIKIAAGLPSDQVKYTPQEFTVNDSLIDIKGMGHVINFLRLDPNEYSHSLTVKDNELFVVGETIYSYDSRYWGSINSESIIGKAYAIF